MLDQYKLLKTEYIGIISSIKIFTYEIDSPHNIYLKPNTYTFPYLYNFYLETVSTIRRIQNRIHSHIVIY